MYGKKSLWVSYLKRLVLKCLLLSCCLSWVIFICWVMWWRWSIVILFWCLRMCCGFGCWFWIYGWLWCLVGWMWFWLNCVSGLMMSCFWLIRYFGSRWCIVWIFRWRMLRVSCVVCVFLMWVRLFIMIFMWWISMLVGMLMVICFGWICCCLLMVCCWWLLSVKLVIIG